MRFYWAISKIRHFLTDNTAGRVISARIEFGQYLPDWHPWEDYSKGYSAKKNLGGGIIFDAIHEIDYARWFFGSVAKVVSMYDKLSNLKIETEDTADILLRFTKGPLVNIHLDYLQRVYSKSCKIVGEKGTIEWRFDDHLVRVYSAFSNKWKEYKEPKGYDLNQMYVDEMKYFLNSIKE